MVRWVVSALLVTLLLLSLVVLSSAKPIGGTNPSYVYGCRVNGTPSTFCTIGTSNCARYYKNFSDPWSGATHDDTDSDIDHYYQTCGQDCNDGDGTIHPGAAETCGNNIDEDCDGFDTACPFAISSFTSAVSGTTVTLNATTNYKASCCFAQADMTYVNYTACNASTQHLAVLTTTGSNSVWTALTSTTQTPGTKTYKVYCKAPP